LKVLRGEWVPVGSPELEIRNPLAVNWDALRKWQLSESLVPREAEIRHAPPSLWETHRTLILWTIFVVLIQSVLIVGGLAQRLWRRRAESLLLESEKRFGTVADAAPVLIWMSGADKLCTFFNKAWLEFTGRKMEQELGNGWAEGVHADDFEKCLSTYLTAFDSRKPFTMQYRLRRHDGEYRFVTDNGVPRFGPRGNFRGYIGACVDITDSLKQQKALHEFEERVALAADAAHLGVWELDTTTNELWVSSKARELFQLPADGPIDPAVFADRIHPEDRIMRAAAVKQAIETQRGYEIEYRALLRDGTVRWIHGRAQCVSDDRGILSRLVGVSMDVTERKQAQELFQIAAESSHLGVWNWDETSGELLWDSTTREIFDIPVEAKMTLGLFYSRVYPPDLELVKKVWRSAMESGVPYQLDFRVQRLDRAVRWVHARGRGYYDEKGKPLRMIGIVFDITERKEAEEQAHKSREQIDRLTRISLLGEMTASIAHELNQPLSAIASNANAAQRFLNQGKLDADTVREILEDIGADARRAHDVIHHIRNTIKKGAAIRERIDLNAVVNHVAHSIRPDARIYACEVDTALEKSLPDVEGDPVQIQQVLINLVSNAFDAMTDTPPKRRKVKIRTRRSGDRTVCVSVRDNGIGIQEEARERLFEQFFTTKTGGLGMGLAIVRSIIETHGGQIAAENVEGGGARFHFTLPIVAANELAPRPNRRVDNLR
jgi:PAS domain S-box-containing protein